MKIITSFLLLFFGLVGICAAQTVTIGSQVWMTKNLAVSTFRNGDPIPEAKTAEEWVKAGDNKQPAWCYWENDPANGVKFGKLYNWFAVNDPRGLAPTGWHIPSDKEWQELQDYLGIENGGQKMKSTSGWDEHLFGGNGTNESGFSALPAGSRSNTGSFEPKGPNNTYVGELGVWWSSTEDPTGLVGIGALRFDYSVFGITLNIKSLGLSVRCIKD